MLRLSVAVCRLWREVLWLNGASYSKSYYWEPIGSRIWEIYWYQNKWPWPLFRGRIKVTSTVALHLTLDISETVRDRGLVPKDNNRKWRMGYRTVTCPMTSRDHSIAIIPFPIGVLWNQATISNGFRDIQRQMWRNGWRDLDTTSEQRSRSFILVLIDFSYTTSYRLSIVTFALGRTV